MLPILAYKSSCSYCSHTANTVATIAAGKLDVQPIDSPEVQTLIRTSNKDIENKPFLLYTKNDVVKIATGLSLARELSRTVGIVDSARIIRAIGRSEYPHANDGGSWLSRRAALATATGLGAITLITLGQSPAAAQSSNRPLARLGTEDGTKRELPQKELEAILEGFYSTAAGAKARRVLTKAGNNIRMLRGTSDGKNPLIVGNQTDFGNKTTLNTAVTTLGDAYLSYQETIENGQITDSRSLVLIPADFNNKGELDSVYIAFRSDGDTYTDTDLSAISTRTALEAQASAKCNSTACRKKGRCFRCQCTKVSVTCAVGCCGGCAWARGNPGSLLTCILTVCAACATWSKCCTSSTCQYRATGNTGC